MKILIKYYCIYGFLWISCAANAQEIAVDRNFSIINLSRHVEVLEDKSKQLTFEQILHQKFSLHTKESINYGFTNAYYWIRFRLKNKDTIPVSLMLEIPNSHLNRLKFYDRDKSGKWQFRLTGDHYPFKQRPFNHPHFVFPIKLDARQTVEYYLWVDKHGEQIQIPLDLHSEAHFSDYSIKLFMFIGIMLGITGLFVILSFMLFIFSRQKIILFY